MLFVFTLTVCLSLVLSQEVSLDDSKEVKTCYESNDKETKEWMDFFLSVTQTLNQNTKNIGLNLNAYKDSLCCAYHELEICALKAVKKNNRLSKISQRVFQSIESFTKTNVCPKFHINSVNCE